MLNNPDLTDPGLLISKEQAEKSLIEKFGALYGASSRIEELLKYHLLEPISEKEITFHHQLIQEYYAAECLLTQLPDLLKKQPEQQYTPFQMNYLNYVKWTEAIKLMYSLLSKKTQIEYLTKLALNIDLMLSITLINSLNPAFQQNARDTIQTLEASQKIKNFAMLLTQPPPADSSSYKFLFENNISEDSTDYLETLIQCLEDFSYDTREYAIIKLSRKYSSESIEILEKFIRRESIADLRALAISKLVRIGSIESIQLIEEALSDKNWLVRVSAAQVIGLWKYEPLVPKLIEMLKDDDYDVRGSVAKALIRIGNSQAISSVLETLEIADKDYIEANEFERFQINSGFIVEALEALKDAPLELRSRTINCLSNIGSKESLVESIEDLQSVIESKPGNWISTVEALAAIDSQQAIEVILELLDGRTDDENLQLFTLPRIVGKLQLSCAIEALEKLIYTSSANEDIANALASLNVVAVLPRLLQLWEQAGGMQYRPAIAKLQSQFGFYNYDVSQSSLQNQSDVDSILQKQLSQGVTNVTNININSGANVGGVNVDSTVHGSQVGANYNYLNNESLKQEIAELRQLVSQLQQTRQPTTEAEAIQVIDAEFHEIQRTDPNRWQAIQKQLHLLKRQLLNPERHLTAGKAAIAEVAKHYLEDSVLAKALITYVDIMSADTDQGE